MRPHSYILDEQHNPLPCEDIRIYGKWFEDMERRTVGHDTIEGNGRKADISTVFLVLDHDLAGEEPVLFETMVCADDDILTYLLESSEQEARSIISQFFGGIDIQRRYTTWDKSEKGHKSMVDFVKVCLLKMPL